MRFAHVVFDLDGTLVDSGADLAASVNHVLRSLGRDALPATTLLGYVGDGARTLVARALGDRGGESQLDVALARFLDHYERHLLDVTRAYPGVPEMLVDLASRGIVMDVLTNKPQAMSVAILGGLGLGTHFRDVLGGDSLSSRKPDPEGLDRLRVSGGVPRERMLLIGDSPVDLQTATAGQVAFCGVTWGLAPERLRAAGPPRLVDDPAALLGVVLGDA